MTMRTQTIAIATLCMVCALAVLMFLAWPDAVQEAASVSAPQTSTGVPECFAEVSEERDLEKVVRVGQGYFGGDRGYDLVCVRIAFDRAIALDPKGYNATWHQLGRIDFIEGKFDDALFKFDKQIEFFGDELPNVYYMQGLTYGYRARESGSAEDWLHAEEAFFRYIELEPQTPWARVDLAWVFFSQGKYQEMKPLLEAGLLIVPEQPWLLNMYGLALLNTGDKEGARLFFEDALYLTKKLTPEDWGQAYPGNDPNVWPVGLAEMIASIEKNLSLAQEQDV